MSFLSELDVELIDDCYWRLKSWLVYQSLMMSDIIMVPAGFETDFASVPRIPFLYELWGDRAHREAVLHDYMYCRDSTPLVSFETANQMFLEAMTSRGKPWYVKYPMYWGVCMFGKRFYHKRSWKDGLCGGDK